MNPDMILRHSRQRLSGIPLESDSDGSLPTNCGDDSPVIEICTSPSFPTVVIGIQKMRKKFFPDIPLVTLQTIDSFAQ